MKNNNTDFSARTKISRILFLFSFCFLFLQSYSANIETYNQEKTFTFEMWNKPVKEVLNYIEKNSQFIFFYYNNTIDIKRNVSLSVKDKPITFVLDQLFKGMDVRYEIKDRQISLKKNEGQQYPQSKKQQKRKLIGTVMDASTDDLLVGVSISVKGTPGVGTITDLEGKFSIEVSNNTECQHFNGFGKALAEKLHDKINGCAALVLAVPVPLVSPDCQAVMPLPAVFISGTGKLLAL